MGEIDSFLSKPFYDCMLLADWAKNLLILHNISPCGLKLHTMHNKNIFITDISFNMKFLSLTHLYLFVFNNYRYCTLNNELSAVFPTYLNKLGWYQ